MQILWIIFSLQDRYAKIPKTHTTEGTSQMQPLWICKYSGQQSKNPYWNSASQRTYKKCEAYIWYLIFDRPVMRQLKKCENCGFITKDLTRHIAMKSPSNATLVTMQPDKRKFRNTNAYPQWHKITHIWSMWQYIQLWVQCEETHGNKTHNTKTR